ncbi:MAG: TonB-dependent receptor [Mariniphaga sp.]
MKKKWIRDALLFGIQTKMWKIMRLNAFFLLLCFSHAWALSGYSQETKLTLKMSDSKIIEVLDAIEEQSEFYFLFNQKLVDVERKVDVDVQEKSIDFILQNLFAGTNVNHMVIDRQIVLTTFNEQLLLQQQPAVSGTVTDSSGQPLPGVTVVVKGTTQGTVTNADGEYSLTSIPDDATLVFSFVGMQTQEVVVGNQMNIDVRMEEETIGIEEVVAIGYGTVKKSDLTGAVANVTEENLTAYPSLNALQSMQGRAAGVTIQSVNAEPGGDFKIRVRGQTSINASSNPLFVVDGLVGGAMPPPEDIASIEVLKDASASAIYGSRGANGVVMITTKSGKVGKVSVKFNSYYSFQEEIGRLDLLNAREFAEYINDARGTEFFDLNNITVDTDWQDLIFQSGHVQNHQLSVSGGTERYQYYVSGVYYDHKGVIKTSAFDRYSLTTNLRFDLSDYIRISLNSTMQSSVQDGVLTQVGGGVTNQGIVTAAHRFDPNQGILDEDGNYTKSKVGIAAFENPMAQIDGRENETRQENIQVNVKAEFDITKGLTFNSTFGTIIRNNRGGTYDSRITNLGEQNMGLANLSYARNYNFLTEQYLNYNLKVGEKNDFVFTGGYSYQNFKNESFSTSNAGFITDALGFWNLSVGTNLQIPNSNYVESEIASFYGRVNYNFDSRYLLTFTSRYDGASQFSEGNKWSFFPSGALSWNIHNEDFWPENDVLSAVKVRTSYGLTGNQAIGAYQSLARISKSFFVLNETSVSAVRPTSIANKDLTWETTSQTNVGLDLGLFNRRINFSGDYYYKKTNDMLFSVPIPAFSGYQSRLENLGSIENKGFEFQIESKNFTNAFQWTSGFNVTMNRNKVLALPGGVDILYAVSPSFTGQYQNSILREGEPVGAFYGYVYEGVYQEGDTFIPGGTFETEPGGEKFADIEPDGVLNSDDRKVIGDPNPKAVWGFNNDFAYKRFSLNIFLQAFTGGDMLNFVRFDLDRLSGNTNATKDALNRWTPENTNTDVPKAYAGRIPIVSTRFVEDGSFLRVKNVSLGYDFAPDFLSKLKLRSARIYFSGQNLLTFTRYSGVDPEVAYRSSNTNLGLDFGSYPAAISYTFGINLEF